MPLPLAERPHLRETVFPGDPPLPSILYVLFKISEGHVYKG